MELLPVTTPILKTGDDLASIIATASSLHDGDIVAISSKAVATVEGAQIDLATVPSSREAEKLAHQYGRSPAFRQAILSEVERLNGRILPSCPHAMLTELKPDGFGEGSLLVPNAGLDQSNCPEGFAIGWPRDPVRSVKDLRISLEEKRREQLLVIGDSQSNYGGQSEQPNNSITNNSPTEPLKIPKVAVIITDSGCRPGRAGLVAIGLTVAGFDPVQSNIGHADLFGEELKLTSEAVADQLATAANFLMGNAAQSTPAVVIRDHGLELNDFCGWVPGIDPTEDLFRGVL